MTAPIIWTPTGAKLLQSSLRDKDGVAFAKITDVTSGAAMVPESQSASFTAAAAKMYLTDTSASAFTATLPSGAANAQIRFIDSEQTWSTNNLTITPASGETIMGNSVNESLICDVSGAWVELVWDATNSWWTVTSNGAVNAATTEYISSGTAWDADDTGGNTIYGASGSLITGALSMDRVKLITFSTAPTSTDEIVIEFSNDGGTCWSPIGTASNGFVGPISTNATDGSAGFSGAFYNSVTGNSINIVFGQYATIDPSGIGVDWESGIRWRVRKTSGRSVSYPEVVPGVSGGIVPAQGLPGRTDGVAIASGYVGEPLNANAGSTIAYGSSGVATNVVSKTLTAGVWAISGMLAFNHSAISGFGYMSASISTSSGVLDDTCLSQLTSLPTTNADTYLPTPVKFINVSTSTTVYLIGRLNYSTVTGGYGNKSRIDAVRIA